ncbi:hypothetical protein LCGC14_0709600 [marine sediment metagenome]|uniref:Essential protein Yae1 N-terminal domain-containing protein n=1 Tax=marine sediment metagenome TaxID=412755 RepID=A0A0F9TN53_9ZZZZ
MPKVYGHVDVEVWCSCGEGLCGQSVGGDGLITIAVCGKCTEVARQEGYEDGFNEGREEGYAHGHQDAVEEQEGE